MQSAVLIHRRRNYTLTLMAAGVVAAVIYTLFSDGLDNTMALVNALFIGSLLGVFVSIIEKRVFDEHLRRKLPFMQLLTVRIVIYAFLVLIILLMVFSVSRVFWFQLTYTEVWQSEEFLNYLKYGDFKVVVFYSIGIIALVIFSYQITRKLGQGYLENIIIGKYYEPKVQDRVFCFLKLYELSRFAGSNDHDKYFAFINDIIYDITETILSHRGIIYQYVEDDMVINWKPDQAFSDSACIRCFFAMRDKLYQRREYYLNEYDFFPEILGAVHMGQVVHGEIGHSKTEILFYGDVLNTTSRILARTSPDNKLLVTGDILDNLKLPGIYTSRDFGECKLTGKNKPVELYNIVERVLERQP